MEYASSTWLSTQLLPWYRIAARRLPWREHPSPYHTLLSELMCQQTRIDTAIPYYHRFLTRWPTLEAFAAADEAEVEQEWAGLGYYSRARNLLKAARAAVALGGIPSDPEQLKRLPGIGPYTAGAVASIAFGVSAPAIDGNVERVLSRVDGRNEDPKQPKGATELRKRAIELLQGVAAGDLNQALMELGATVCTPKKPKCEICPWKVACIGFASGEPERFPNKAKKPPPMPIHAAVAVWWRDGRLLAGRRSKGLLAGMWEPILLATEQPPTETDLIAQAESQFGWRITPQFAVGEVLHVFSHRRLLAKVWRVEAENEPSELGGYSSLDWVDPLHPHVPWSTLARKLVDMDTKGNLYEDLSLFPSLAADAAGWESVDDGS